jgi:hypothetical protein
MPLTERDRLIISTKASLLEAAALALNTRIKVDRGSDAWHEAHTILAKAKKLLKELEDGEGTTAAETAKSSKG